MDSKETIKWKECKSYPLIKLEISSASHPLFTGKQRVANTGGRIDPFKKKYDKREKMISNTVPLGRFGTPDEKGRGVSRIRRRKLYHGNRIVRGWRVRTGVA